MLVSGDNVYHSSDAGVNWDLVVKDQPKSLSMSDSGMVQMIIGEQQVVITNDFGTNWQRVYAEPHC